MGCDYYVIKQLGVKHVDDHDNEHITTIELQRDRCYFSEIESVDSDDTDYFNSNRYDKYLTVTHQPRILFQNNKWKNEYIQDKYQDLVTNEIGNDMIVSIIKQEVRYLR